MLNKPGDTPEKSEKREAVVIKKYANRRLYNTETSTYVTLEDLATMVRGDRDFVVYDAKTGDELTHSVLTQIIVEQESRAAGGSQMLPIPFLRQLIRFYDDSIGRMVPSYLQMSLETLVKEQERFRSQFANAWAPVSFEAYQEQARKNLAILDQAMTMWSPFAAGQRGAPGKPGEAGAMPTAGAESSHQAASATAGATPDELVLLKAEMARMQDKIEKLSKDRS